MFHERPADLSPADLDALRAAAFAVADAARAACLPHFRAAGLTAEDKGGPGWFDPVTVADREAEAAMREVLGRLRPGDAILGEEQGTSRGASGRETGLSWVLDPIDGTRGFMAGTPTWGVLVALNDGARPVLGVIDQPFTGERFWGVSHGTRRGAEWTRGADARPLRTRPCAGLASATLFTTFPEVGTAAERAGFEAVRDRARLARYGMDCYAYALIAAGSVDLVIEAGLAAYDVQALIPVIEGAGGVITDWRGGDCQRGGRVLAAGDPRTHAEALAILSQAP
jgi:histidinol phosphatase-like enzyme (inositol monophosphatase family)